MDLGHQPRGFEELAAIFGLLGRPMPHYFAHIVIMLVIFLIDSAIAILFSSFYQMFEGSIPKTGISDIKNLHYGLAFK